MSRSIKQKDLDTFFGFVLSPDRTIESLVRSYVAFHGDINWGQQEVFFTTLRDAMGPAAAHLRRPDVLGPNGEINRQILAATAPDLVDAYFTAERPPNLHAIEILPASRNEWRDTTLPPPMNSLLKQDIRPAFQIFRATCRTIFASPYGYQAYDAQRGVFWPQLASRAFDRSVDRYEHIAMDRPLVVAMDQFDGSNFSHFLCDSVSRILHFRLRFPAEATRCVFLMGGVPGPLHRLVLHQIEALTGVAKTQFLFLDRPVVLRCNQAAFFFSDQRAALAHPLQMAHPASVRLVRDLFAPVRLMPTGTPRIYISRGDADMRRIVNEEELCQALMKDGYTVVRLSDHDVVQQMALVSGARSIVAPHGMGLTWLLFHRGLAHVSELFHPTIGSETYTFLARALGMDYRFLLGDDARDHKAGYSVSVDAVMSLIAGR